MAKIIKFPKQQKPFKVPLDLELEHAIAHIIETDIAEGRAKNIYDIASPELAAEFDKLGIVQIGLVKDTVSEEELKDLLEKLKELKVQFN